MFNSIKRALARRRSVRLDGIILFFNHSREELHDILFQTLHMSGSKAPVTPGHLLPARELLGDLLMEIGDREAAALAYEASLAVSPNRARSVAGLARASGG